jgi:dihydrofolate reductase
MSQSIAYTFSITWSIVNKKWAIGKDGELMYSLPGDMRFFRETTKGKNVIMGRKTLDSFPGGAPLKNRVNIVISRNSDERDVIWVKDPIEALCKANNKDDTFLIGGASVYEQLIDYCTEAYVTIIEDYSDGDSYFPNLEEREGWEVYEKSDSFFENGLSYRFCKFKNNNPKEL